MAVYKYTTIPDLRDEGITEKMVSDARAAKLIERISKEINELTDQWFVPVAQRLNLDGRGGSLAYAGIPVLKVDTLEILPERTKDPGIARVGAVEPSYVLGFSSELPKFDDRYSISSPFRPATLAPDHTLDDRSVRALIPFPEGINNVQVDGFFGWTEQRQDFTTKLAVDMKPDDASCTLDDASGVEPGHVLTFSIPLLGQSKTLYTAWVKSVSGNVVTFVESASDLANTMPIGTRVGDFGAVPAQIQTACMMLVNRRRGGIGNPVLTEEEFFSRLTGETTDNYKYSLKAKTDVTLDDPINTILNQFVRPPFVGLA